VAGSPDAEPFLHLVIEVADTQCGQRDHSLFPMLAMIAG
jgi:hypothetical protein